MGDAQAKKGQSKFVEPIKSLVDIGRVKGLLSEKPRDFCLFVVGINTALRANELLAIKCGEVKHLKAGDDLLVFQKKNQKKRRITLSGVCVSAIKGCLATKGNYGEEDFLFTGRQGEKALTVGYLNMLIKSWCGELGIKGNYGSHTLRKTFGYHQRITFEVSLAVLVEVYGHSNQRITLDYLCVQPDEIKKVYENEL